MLPELPDSHSDDSGPPAVVARGIRVRGPWGPVYGPVDLEVPAGGVNVLVCPAGSGRTALLMTIAGRMAPQSGELTVFGAGDVHNIFATSALAGIDELDTVPESVTVRDLITEQLRWDAPWYRLVRRADMAALTAICAPVFGPHPLPPLDEYFEELSELDRLLLRIALANTKRPPLLVVGNLDFVTSDLNRDLLIERLIDLGREQTIVTATVNGVSGHDVRSQIPVANADRAELSESQKGTG
ncbi:ATP-binding cassette domain-containing protein [Mycobacterium sp. ENV421]|uniref:ATP-binding cassette domain-containing protein n=1 Tax=Mycobacterium sp. ENV421 TaxID=1213407 RepID=UPI001E54C51E|nr:ATP-binding cassette domain-containing protein [Mycobacterium sp. ENV421]